MTRFNALLAALLVVCALGLVSAQQRARHLFVDLERAQSRSQQLEVQWDQLQLDQTGLSKASLIDSRARKGLAMQPLSADKTLHLSIDKPAQHSAGKAAGPEAAR